MITQLQAQALIPLLEKFSIDESFPDREHNPNVMCVPIEAAAKHGANVITLDDYPWFHGADSDATGKRVLVFDKRGLTEFAYSPWRALETERRIAKDNLERGG